MGLAALTVSMALAWGLLAPAALGAASQPEARFSEPQPVSLTAADGTRLVAGLHRGVSPKARMLVLAPGFGQRSGTVTLRFIAGLLTPTADVLVLDFRGTGESQGRYNFGSEEPQDLQAALAWARERYRKVDLLGQSMGGTIAVLATAQGPLKPDRLLLMSPPTKVEHVVSSGGIFAHPFDLLWNHGSKVQHGSVDPFFRWGSIFAPKPAADELAPQLGVPSHTLVGGRDFLVFAKLSRRIYDAAPEPETWTHWPKGAHAEHMALQDPDGFVAWVRQSLQSPPKP